MIEITGNLWNVEADVRVITTNGFIKKNGQAVMGRGCALEAAKKYVELPLQLGKLLNQFGNHCFYFETKSLITFPVKHDWMDYADLNLIQRSAKELCELTNRYKFTNVVLPRPGCGNGGLEWQDVKPILEDQLDDRFSVITFK